LLCPTVEVRGIEDEVDVGIVWLEAIADVGGNHLTIIDAQQWLQEVSFDTDARVECNDIADTNPADRSTLQQQMPGQTLCDEPSLPPLADRCFKSTRLSLRIMIGELSIYGPSLTLEGFHDRL
jgi:hypothetical protein